MFYKNDNGKWFKGNEVHFPDGTILNSENRIEQDGWFWSDTQPAEYVEETIIESTPSNLI